MATRRAVNTRQAAQPAQPATDEIFPDSDAPQLGAADFQTQAAAEFLRLARLNRAQEQISDRTKLVLGPGEPIFARLQEIRIGKGDRKDFNIYDMETANGDLVFLLGSGDLDNKISARHVGHVLGICWTDSQDIGKQSQMKIYTVYDFGAKFPK